MNKKHMISLCLAVILLVCAVVFLSAPRARAEDTTHIHCVCGGLKPEGHTCKDVTWTAWDGTSTSGNFYLTEDVELKDTLTLTAGTTLSIDLNGHTLTGAASRRVFYKNSSGNNANLNICDSVGTGKIVGKGAAGAGEVVAILRNGVFNLYGGTVELDADTTAGSSTRVVRLGLISGANTYKGTFNMYGGKLTGGNVKSDGGAVSINTNNSVFNMYGGEITGNTATGNGGGVYVAAGATFQVSGDAKIMDNAPNNVYLPSDAAMTVTGLGEDASVGVTTENMAVGDIIGTADADPNGKIFCDDSSKIVVRDEAGSLTLAEKPTHIHCVCGGLKPEGHTCEDVEWQPWDGTSTEGNFYLTKDITLYAELVIPGNFNLDLNGYTLIGKAGIRIIRLSSSNSVVNICDCVGTGKIISGNTTTNGGAIFAQNGSLNLYGGTLENVGDGGSNSRLVKVGNSSNAFGTFRMYGGKLTGGNVDGNGGGVTVANNGSAFYMYGGEISGNKATGSGGGVYVPAGAAFQVSGDAKITGNTPSNVYLPSGAAMSVVELGSEASIGLTGSEGVVGTADADPDGRVFSDNDLEVCYSNGSLTLEKPGHRHCVCGGLGEIGDHTKCESVVWQPWDGTSTDGNFYLTDDVRLTTRLSIGTNKTLNLDLNGHTIFAANDYQAFMLSSGTAELNICDCVGIGKIVSGNSFAENTNGGLIFAQAGKLNLYGGTLELKITNENVSESTRLVKIGNKTNTGTFHMYGGKLTGGNVDGDGGAVTIANSGSAFYMYGGEISGNAATGSGGVYVPAGATFQVSGNAKITGNAGSNVYLRSGAAMTVIDLGENASIGVTAEDAVIGEANVDPDGKIFSDDDDKTVKFDGNTITIVHMHCICGGLGTIGKHIQCESVEWTPWDGKATSGNFYLTKDLKLTGLVTLIKGDTLNLDLNGYTLTGADGKCIFQMSISGGSATLNICDCKDTGRIVCSNETNTGGLVDMRRNATFNLYGGTLEMKAGISGAHGRLVRVGHSTYAATFNMYGGTLTGGNVATTDDEGNVTGGNGGGIYVTNSASTLNLYGGSIENCAAAGNGSHIYVAKGGTVNVFGDVQVENLHLSYGAVIGADGMTDNGAVRFTAGTTDGAVVCTRTGASDDWANGHLIWDASEDDARVLTPVGDRVYLLKANTPAAKVGGTEYTTLYEAVQENPGALITLETNFDENMTVSGKDLLIDLNGHTLSGAITLGKDAEGKDVTLQGFDSSSDKYGLPSGKLSAALSGGSVAKTTQNTANKKRYLAVEVDGSWTFNRFYIGMQSITADVNSGDIGYKAIVGGNTNVESMLAADGNAFGFKVWVREDIVKTCGLTKDAFYTGKTTTLNITNQLSTIQKVYAEQDPTYTGVAKELADKPVNAQVTISFADGTTVESSTYAYSVVNMYKELNNGFDGLSGLRKLKLKNLTDTYPVMKEWDLDKITGYESTGEEWYETAFRVGFSKVDITPSYSVPLAGYGNTSSRMSNNVLDHLYTHCTAIADEDGNTVLLFNNDLQRTTADLTKKVRDAVSAKLGIPENNIIISASHTHSGPDMQNRNEASIVQYLADITEWMTQAAEKAVADLKPAQMYIGRVDIPNLSYLRHYQLRNGTKVGYASMIKSSGFLYQYDQEAAASHVGTPDTTMQIVKFTREGGRDVMLCNWQVHNSFTGGAKKYDISADIVGAFCEQLGNELNCNVSYFQGAAGNVSYESEIYSEKQSAPTSHTAYAQKMVQAVKNAGNIYENVATGKVQATQVTYKATIDHSEDDKLEAAQMVKKIWEETNDRAQADAAGAPYGIRSPYHAGAIITRAGLTGTTNSLELDAISIGDVSFVTACYEMFTGNGLYIKENSPYKMTFVTCYANSHNGYMPSADAFTYENYERDTTRFVQGTAEAVAEQFVSMLNALHAQG